MRPDRVAVLWPGPGDGTSLQRLAHAPVQLAIEPISTPTVGRCRYVLVSLLVPLSGNALGGIGRYASVLFPAFMLTGTMGSPRVFDAILVISAIFRTFFLTLLIAWCPLH